MAQTQRNKAKIRIDSHPDFPKTQDAALMTTSKLSAHINTMLSQIFADYVGCKIYVHLEDANNPIETELYFGMNVKNESSRKLRAFMPYQDQVRARTTPAGQMDFVGMTVGHNRAIQSNKVAEITQDGIDILVPFLNYPVLCRLPKDPTAKQLVDMKIVCESSLPSGLAGQGGAASFTVYNIVRCVDINMILHTLFSGDNDNYIYSVVPQKPIIMPNMMPMQPQDKTVPQKWLFNILRIDRDNFKDICIELGAYSGADLNIYTETY